MGGSSGFGHHRVFSIIIILIPLLIEYNLAILHDEAGAAAADIIPIGISILIGVINEVIAAVLVFLIVDILAVGRQRSSLPAGLPPVRTLFIALKLGAGGIDCNGIILAVGGKLTFYPDIIKDIQGFPLSIHQAEGFDIISRGRT